MLAAALLAGAVAHVLREPFSGPSFADAKSFLAARLAERWHDAEARTALARELADTLGLRVTLNDTQGALLVSAGARCRGRDASIRIERGGIHLGEATLCVPRRPHRLRDGLILIAAFMLGLWWASGVIARRLSRPMVETAKVAAEIGQGAYDARVHTNPRAPAEVRRMAAAINEMAQRIESALGEQRLLLASVSHEIRTPLGHLRLLVDHALDAGLEAELARKLEEEILEMDELVAQLLAGSKLDALGPEVHSLDAVDCARAALERAGEPLDKLRSTTAVPLEADPTLVARALANLLRNAREHGEGLVELKVEGDAREVRFHVIDQGSGLTEAELERCLRPFVRDGADSAGSLGLGLALTERIAKAHGGSLRVLSHDATRTSNEESTPKGAHLVLRLAATRPRTSRPLV